MQQILNIVDKAKILRLGLFDKEYPYVVPLHYGYEYAESRLFFYMHSAKEGHKLAVLAIDPSSERSKGSILGDKTRMERLAIEPDVFIRPSPSAGSLGGVARKTRETIVLCEAAGYDTIFVETVGVGQSEIAVHSMVDYFLLIQLAGTGDELQGIKRGIMEMADGIVINKCDGDNIERANLAAAQFRNALHLYPLPPSGFLPEVITYSGYYDLNIEGVWDMIDRYFAHVKANGYFDEKRHEQERYWMRETINEQSRHRLSLPAMCLTFTTIKSPTSIPNHEKNSHYLVVGRCGTALLPVCQKPIPAGQKRREIGSFYNTGALLRAQQCRQQPRSTAHSGHQGRL